MTTTTFLRRLPPLVTTSAAVFGFLLPCIYALTTDGVILLSFRYSVVDDPFSILQSWKYEDDTPCSWHGVTCADGSSHVTSLSLPNSRLLASIPSDLGMLERLERLDLSNNSINGSLPESLFNGTTLRFLDLSSNLISGELPDSVEKSLNLQSLNLSDNALVGKLPESLGSLLNLAAVSLKNNYFSGEIPRGFKSVEFLDLSSNLINGSLPSDLGSNHLRYLNLSYNRISGEIPAGFGENIPEIAAVDLTFNNLSGQIPESRVFKNQESKVFDGNNLSVQRPSPPLPQVNISGPTSPPAIAAIPRMMGSSPVNGKETVPDKKPGLKPAVIIGIVVGDIALVAILGIIFFYIYRSKNKKESALAKQANGSVKENWSSSSSSSSESRVFSKWSCLRKTQQDKEEEEEEEEDGEEESETTEYDTEEQKNQRRGENDGEKKGRLVTVDGEKEQLELETLLKASAYILGATGSSIMYKAVLEDGTAYAVRRIGESSLDRFRDFEAQVRLVAKLVHPNLVRIRGFYWGTDEKLVIYDFVPNGSLANARYRKVGSSPCHFPWEARLKIAKGVARGLAYLHEKKHVHGNLKPSNVLLGYDMEPKIGDFGLERLLTGDTSYRTGGSSRIFGSKRSMISHDLGAIGSVGPSPSPSPSSVGYTSPYHAPESLRSLKPSPKWDVYSFGVILLELLTGKIIVVDELGQGNGLVIEDKGRALRMADVAIRCELEGKEEALLACFKMGLNCASPIPQKRPNMKEVVQVLEKFPISISTLSYHYGH